MSGVWHIASQCPNKRVMTIIEGGFAVEEVGEDGQTHDDLLNTLETYYEDKEACTVEKIDTEPFMSLMMRKVPPTVSSDENKQRENLFYTGCKINGNLCLLIVDSGSCTNVAAASMVEKLQLPIVPHPRPYKLQWLNDRECLHVKSQVQVPITIGVGYQDEVLCDILPMSTARTFGEAMAI